MRLLQPTDFFAEAAAALKRGGLVLFAEPAGHVKAAMFERELEAGKAAGLEPVSRLAIRGSFATVLRKV